MPSAAPAPGAGDPERLQRRLERERRARREAERIAEDATRALYKEQVKLAAISAVASSANESDSTVDTTLRGLRELLDNTVWHQARACGPGAAGATETLAALVGESGHERALAEAPLTPAARQALASATTIQCEQVQLEAGATGSGGDGAACYCTIATGGQVFGVIEAYAERPDDDFAFSRQILEGIAQELAYVYKRERDHSVIEHMAYHDTLTGLGNRALFHDRLELALRRARREERAMALLYFDVDDFKAINDRLGHGAGDRYLCALAERMAGVARETDTIARLSGDEFAVVLDCVASPEAAEGVAQRVLAQLCTALTLGDTQIAPSISIGVAAYPDDATEAAGLLQCADAAMYRAKALGGAQVAAFDPEIARRRERERAADDRLRAAVEADELEPHYQPLIDLASGRVVGAEALLRWPAADGTSPGEFIPRLERLGLMEAAGARVLWSAIADAARWRDGGGAPLRTIAINVSPVQLSSDAFLDELDAALRAHALPAHHVTLEITEGLYLEGEPAVIERLRALRRRGVRVALDDFGTGYSSLGYLQNLPIDVLKIDKSFILGLGAKAHYTNLVSAIIGLAEALFIEVTAEGIESAEVGAAVRRLGCHYGQGFHYGAAVDRHTLQARIGDRAA